MKLVVDTGVFIALLADQDVGLINPVNSKPVTRTKDRASALVDHISGSKGVIMIPAPVLAEYLVKVPRNDWEALIQRINSFSCFEVVAFDQIAAIECAKLLDPAELKQMKGQHQEAITKAKINFDRQITSIALRVQADELWTQDGDVYKLGVRARIRTKSLADIEPKPTQISLDVSSGKPKAPKPNKPKKSKKT